MGREALEAYLSFLEEYAGFFEETARHEEEKQADLKSNQIKRIEAALSRQQAVVMEMSNLEKRRDALQQAAGLGQADFWEIAGQLENGERERFLQAVERLQAAVTGLRQSNAQSMELAQDRLDVISTLLPELPRETYSPYTSRKGPDHGKSSLFNSKI